MDTHVKVVGWLWIVWAVVSIFMAIGGLAIANSNVSGQGDSTLATTGILCFFVPGIIGDFLAGYGLLKYRNWGRILAIIMAIINLLNIPFGTALGIYTLIIMFNKETKALISGEGTPPELAKVS